MNKQLPSWVCCQLGAREHYAIPRALHQAGQLSHLITDAWISHNSLLNILPKSVLTNLRERYHHDLAQASVESFTSSLVRFELNQRMKKSLGWQRMIARNAWFQNLALQSLKRISAQIDYPITLFAYSYAALDLFQYAKSQGWQTVLGQIDPGIAEEQLVVDKYVSHPTYNSSCKVAPAKYWIDWQQECLLSDRIIVNSQWSSEALQKVGIPRQKIDIIPLAYQTPYNTRSYTRSYPSSFSKERPLRVLFLGQIILRKGIVALLEAADILSNQPIEFWLVGFPGISLAQTKPNIKLIGAIPRSLTDQYYQMADVFLFPTLSDGFGLTQLEAQAWKLPIIASKFCADVVKDNVNGILLNEVSGEAIAQALKSCINNPNKLEIFARQSVDITNFNLLNLQHHLQSHYIPT